MEEEEEEEWMWNPRWLTSGEWGWTI